VAFLLPQLTTLIDESTTARLPTIDVFGRRIKEKMAPFFRDEQENEHFRKPALRITGSKISDFQSSQILFGWLVEAQGHCSID